MGRCTGLKFNIAGAVIFGVLIVLSGLYTNANVEAVAFFLPWSLIIIVAEIALFLYFLAGALRKRK